MTKRHDEIFRDVLGGLDTSEGAPENGNLKARLDATEKGAARFLKRSTALAEANSGDRVEKTLFLVDPSRCRMWAGHNRRQDLLNAESCADLIEGIRAQGGQEFPAIVRKVADGLHEFEVICGARRHFAVSWLRANNYPQMRFLIEVRDLTDEEAFRLADIENRDRADISDYERAVDYAKAITAYYGGVQKAMADRLEVSEAWLSRYLALASLPEEIVGAYARVTEIRELHARTLKPLLANPVTRKQLLAQAEELARKKAEAMRDGVGLPDGVATFRLLTAAARKPKADRREKSPRLYRAEGVDDGILVRKSGNKAVVEFSAGISRSALEAAFALFLEDRFGAGNAELPIGKS